MAKKLYNGGCHCKKVRFEVMADLDDVITCNCSHCSAKGFILHFVNKDDFTILRGRENLTEYYFNKKAIRHLFCKDCGVESFAEGIAFPKVAINVRCLDNVDLSQLSPTEYNGKDL